MDRLEAVPHVGEGTAHNHAHRVLNVRILHLVFQINFHDLLIGECNVLCLEIIVFCQTFSLLTETTNLNQ